MHVRLVSSKGDSTMSCNDLSMHTVREEHWAANRSHAYMVNISAGQINPPSLMRKYFCPGMDVQVETFPIEKSCASCLLETLYRRHRGTPLRHLVKTYVCDDNPCESKLIRTRCGHY